MNKLSDRDLEYTQNLAITVEDLNARVQRGARVVETSLIKDDVNTFVRVILEDPYLQFYYIQIV